MDLWIFDIVDIIQGKFSWRRMLVRQAGFWIGMGCLIGGAVSAVQILELGWPWYIAVWATFSSLAAGLIFVVAGYFLARKL